MAIGIANNRIWREWIARTKRPDNKVDDPIVVIIVLANADQPPSSNCPSVLANFETAGADKDPRMDLSKNERTVNCNTQLANVQHRPMN